MTDQFLFDEESHPQKGNNGDEYLSFFDHGPSQKDDRLQVSHQQLQNLTPQDILARSSFSNINSPMNIGNDNISVNANNSNAQSISPVTVFSPNITNQTITNGSPMNVVSPQQILSQRNTPRHTILEDFVGSSQHDNDSQNTLADRVGIFTSLQPRNQHFQNIGLDPQQQSSHQHLALQQLQQQRMNLQAQAQMQAQIQAQIQAQSQSQIQAQSQPLQNVPSQSNIQRQILQSLDLDAQKRVTQELNNKQYELFIRSFMEHCKRQNIQFNPNPEICNTKINLFILYMIVQKMGGGETVTRIQQWTLVAQKFNIISPNAGESVASYYYKILLPYEKYLTTSDGVKEIQTKRLILQQCLQETLKIVRQQSLQTMPNSQESSQVINHTQQQQQFQQKQMQTPKLRKPRHKRKTKKEIEDERRKLEELQRQRSIQIEKQQQQKILLGQQLKLHQEKVLKHHEEQLKKLPKVYKRSFVRNYVPIRRSIDTQNGYDIRAISQVGEKIEASKPIFLFAPELGTINLHALTMSIQSGYNAEINTALNTLLVTSADSNLQIPLGSCQELLDSLCILACEKLQKLYRGDLRRKVTEYIICKEVDVEKFLSNPISFNGNTRIEQIFQASKKQFEDDNETELKIQVDSLTGTDMSQVNATLQLNIDTEEPDLFKLKTLPIKRWDYMPDPLRLRGLKKDDKLSVVSYIHMLININEEVDNIFTKCNVRGSEDPHILLIDQLSTISMILRNLSFNNENASAIAKNIHFQRYLSDLLWMLFTQAEKFVFHRKSLNFKKDTIIILSNIADMLKIDNPVDACLLLFLMLSFGEPKPVLNSNSYFTYSEYSVKVEKYQCYGVDVIAKLMSLGYPNRTNFKCVLLNSFEDENQDVTVCQQLLRRYNNGTKFKLLNDIFSLTVCSIPFKQLNQIPTLIEDCISIISQALTVLLSILKFITIEEETLFSDYNLPYLWLISEENIGCNIRRLSESLSNMCIQNSNLKHLHQIFGIVGPKSLKVLRIMIEKSVDLCTSQEKKMEILKALHSIPNLFPSDTAAITIMMNPVTNSDIAKQMRLLYNLNNDIFSKAA